MKRNQRVFEKIPVFCFKRKENRRFAIIRIRKGKAKTKAVVPKERINDEIAVNEVRLIDENNKQIGVVSLQEALRHAEEAELDLVEVSPNAEPPVCRILDFSKYYYQKERKNREAMKKQHTVQLKEVKFGPNTDEHDYNFKKNNAIKFFKHHNKVKFTVKFKGRQIAHKELGYDVLDRLMNDLADIAEVDSKATAEKNYISMIMSPKRDISKILETESKEHELATNEENDE